MNPGKIKWHFRRACLRKANLSLEEADRIVDLWASQGKLLYYYKCEFCLSIHLTRTMPSEFERPDLEVLSKTS